MTGAAASATACPFCAARGAGDLCQNCNRDKSAARRVCGQCQAQTPVDEPSCQACGRRQRNELRWKIPLITAMFIGAVTLAILVRSL